MSDQVVPRLVHRTDTEVPDLPGNVTGGKGRNVGTDITGSSNDAKVAESTPLDRVSSFADDIRPGHRHALGSSAPCRTAVAVRMVGAGGSGGTATEAVLEYADLYNGIYRSHTVGVGNSRLNRREFISIRDVACAIAGSQRDEQGEVYAIRRPFHDKAELVVGIITEGQVDSRPDSQNRSQVGWSGRCVRCSNQNRVRVQGWPDGIHGIHTVNIIPVGYAG